MNKKLFTSLALCTSILAMTSFPVLGKTTNHSIQKVTTYQVDVNESLYVPYEKSTTELFEKGFVTGFGSAVTFKGYDKDGNPQFYAITDRGPNADAPSYTVDGKVKPSKIFPSPSFTPSIGIVTLKNGKAVIDEAITIKDTNGKNISGLPLQEGLVGSTGEVALDMNLTHLGYDVNGLDTEGIAVDKDGNFWICDEYGPFLVKLNANGKILKKYAPGQGLPEILKYRIANRGFEGLTISPSGKIFVSVQSVLDVEGQTSKTATFTRIIEFDPKTEEVKTYAYPINTSDYKSPKDCKIGDIYALNDNTLLVIEQGKLKDGTMSNLIYKADLSKASDITNATYKGKALEFIADTALIKNYKFATKEKLVDLRELGWTAEKAEGLCLLDDKTIAVINDNDFGLTMDITDTSLNNPDITKYVYDPQNQTFTYTGNLTPNIAIKENTEPAELWTIQMSSSLK